MKSATRRPATGSHGRGRSAVAITGSVRVDARRSPARRLATCSARRERLLAPGEDDEVASAEPVGAEVAGDALGIRVARR